MMPLQFKLAAILGAVLLAIVAGLGLHTHGVHLGKKIERSEWQKTEIARQEAQTEAITAAIEKNEQTRLAQEEITRKIAHDYETKLSQVRSTAAAERAAVNRAGGLRVSRAAVCDQPTEPAETASAGIRDEAAAAAVRLPQQIEDDLWRFANDADELSEQLRACQQWITDHDFYGVF